LRPLRGGHSISNVLLVICGEVEIGFGRYCHDRLAAALPDIAERGQGFNQLDPEVLLEFPALDNFRIFCERLAGAGVSDRSQKAAGRYLSGAGSLRLRFSRLERRLWAFVRPSSTAEGTP
jgi:hypothetical protein